MILYKNVDISDLESILKKGILSLDKSKNNNWDSGKRANNPTDCVYLFSPIEGKANVFPNYGTALIEVDVKDEIKSCLERNDSHQNDYDEYVVNEVSPKQIKRIMIPKIFSKRLKLSETVQKAIIWCDINAMIYGENGFEPATDDTLHQFAKTAEIEKSSRFNFFRGINQKNEMIDLYEVKYIF